VTFSFCLETKRNKKFKAYDILAKIDSKKAVRNQTRRRASSSNMVASLPFFHQFLNAKISNATTCFGESLGSFVQDFTG